MVQESQESKKAQPTFCWPQVLHEPRNYIRASNQLSPGYTYWTQRRFAPAREGRLILAERWSTGKQWEQ